MSGQLLDATRAACKGLPKLMDPPGGHTCASERAALDVCYTCPIWAECRMWVLDLDERNDPGGVCGGLTEAERTRIRTGHQRRLRLRQPPTPDGLKHCRRCDETKPYAEFYLDSRLKDGHACYCKTCYNKLKKEARARRAYRQQGAA